MNKIGTQAKLNTLEKVKAIYLSSELFTVENDLVRYTLLSNIDMFECVGALFSSRRP